MSEDAYFNCLSAIGCDKNISTCKQNCCDGQHCVIYLEERIRKAVLFEGVDYDRLRELADAERENRITIHVYGNCHRCPNMIGRTIKDEPCKSCYERALASAGEGAE